MIAQLLRIVGPGHRRAVWTYLAATTVYAVSEGAVFGLLVPFLSALLDGRTTTAAHWLPALAATVALGWVAHYLMGLDALRLGSLWRRALYERIGSHVVALPLGWFDQARTGTVEQVLGAGVRSVVATTLMAQRLLGAVVTPLTLLVFLLCADWRVALAALVTVPPVLAVFAVARRLGDRSEAAHNAAQAAASERLVEFAGAQPVLRANGRADSSRQLLHTALERQYEAERRGVVAALPGLYLGQLAIQLAFTAVLAVGLLLLTHNTVGPARVLAILVLGVHFLRPIGEVSGAAASLRAAQAAIARIDDLMATPTLPEPSRPLPMGAPSVELSDVRFGYDAERPVLDGLTLTVPAGSTTALVGPSGAGKTTVIKLVARFFDVDAGTVRVGGVDVRELSGADLLGSIALVFQDVHLFDTTIEENIRIGRPDATDEQVRDAGRRARVDTVVRRLPDGWGTRVGEGGGLLSGGERQRVAIARALLKDAPIVLLDEATSALDAENEAAIHEALTELGRGRTLLVVAHRLTTIAGADQIAVLDSGRVVETGVHADLLAADGRYARLWRERERSRGWRLTNQADDLAHRP